MGIEDKEALVTMRKAVMKYKTRHLKLLSSIKKHGNTDKIEYPIPLLVYSADEDVVYTHSNILVNDKCVLDPTASLSISARLRAHAPDSKALLSSKKVSIHSTVCDMCKNTPYSIYDRAPSIVTKVQNDFVPFHIYVCETERDHIELFRAKVHSCMDFDGYYDKTVSRAILQQNLDVWPSSFFAHVPKFTGVMLKNSKGEAAGRVFVWTHNKRKYHGAVKSSVAGVSGIFTTLLKKKWPSITYSYGKLYIDTEFTVPPLHIKGLGLYLMPIPYHDTISSQYYVSWCEDTKLFTVSPTQSKGSVCIVNCYNWNGYISHELKPVGHYDEIIKNHFAVTTEKAA